MPNPLKAELIKERRKRLAEAGISDRQIVIEVGKKPPAPKALAMRYSTLLGVFQKSVNAKIFAALDPLVRAIGFTEDGLERTDAIDKQVADVFVELVKLVDQFLSVEKLIVGVTNQGAAISIFNAKKYAKPLFRILGLNDLPAGRERTILNGWTRNNLKLIKSVNVEQLDRIESLMYQSAQTGARPKGITEQVQRIMKSSTSRAKLIGRDQTLKLSGQLDQAKQTNVGIEGYFWRTSLDGDRVRPAHRAREGERFSWDNPPEDGAPGQPILCRCTAEPDLRAILGDLS